MAIEFYQHETTGGLYAAEFRDNGDTLVAVVGPLAWAEVMGFITANASIPTDGVDAADIAADNAWFLQNWLRFHRLSPMDLYHLRPPRAGEVEITEDWE